jgi:hypothetical protein
MEDSGEVEKQWDGTCAGARDLQFTYAYISLKCQDHSSIRRMYSCNSLKSSAFFSSCDDRLPAKGIPGD